MTVPGRRDRRCRWHRRLLDRHPHRPASRPFVIEALALVGVRAGLSGLDRESRPIGGRPPAGWSAGSGLTSTPTASWPPVWAPRSSWPRPPSTSVSGLPTATPCSTRPSPIPTYAMGAVLAGCRAGAGARAGRRRARTSPRSTEADAARALMLWANSPSNPTGQLTDLGAAAGWGRATGSPCSPTSATPSSPGTGRPGSILDPRSRRRDRRPLPVQAVQPGRSAGRVLRRRPRAGGVSPRGAPARRPDGARPGAGRRRQRPSTTTPMSTSSGTATASGCPSWPMCSGGGGCRYRRRPGASTSGPRCPRAWPTVVGGWPSGWPPTAASWSARATSTATTAPDSSASPSSSRWSDSSWWPTPGRGGPAVPGDLRVGPAAGQG